MEIFGKYTRWKQWILNSSKFFLILTLRFANKYGDVVSYRFLFNAPRIIITGPNELKHVLVMNEHNYIKDQTATGLIQSIFGEV